MLRVAIAAVAAATAIYFLGKKKKIFVSYHYAGDRHYKRLMTAWAANKSIELEYEDISTDLSISSENTAYIRRKISEAIRRCDVFVVLIGQRSHASDWVNWEINKAKAFNKKIVAIKERRSFPSPKAILSAGAVWVYGFDQRKIKAAIGV